MDSPTQTQTPDLARLRVEYSRQSLSEADVDRDPIVQLSQWLSQALASGAQEPNAMTLATSTRDGRPSARIILLKGADSNGLVFFTNYQSSKAKELEANPLAAVVGWWPELERQVRVEGTVARTSVQESRDYFNQRPSLSRLGSAVSPQSQVVGSRQELEDRFEELRRQFPDGNIPCPDHWGGYRITPSRFEFWQGRVSRLHDRIEYVREKTGWTIRRLAP